MGYKGHKTITATNTSTNTKEKKQETETEKEQSEEKKNKTNENPRANPPRTPLTTPPHRSPARSLKSLTHVDHPIVHRVSLPLFLKSLFRRRIFILFRPSLTPLEPKTPLPTLISSDLFREKWVSSCRRVKRGSSKKYVARCCAY